MKLTQLLINGMIIILDTQKTVVVSPLSVYHGFYLPFVLKIHYIRHCVTVFCVSKIIIMPFISNCVNAKNPVSIRDKIISLFSDKDKRLVSTETL
jgi:hypothetical protein